MSTAKLPFTQRFGVGLPSVPLDKDVPESARIGLIILLTDLCGTQLFRGWVVAVAEGLRVARQRSTERGNVPCFACNSAKGSVAQSIPQAAPAK